MGARAFAGWLARREDEAVSQDSHVRTGAIRTAAFAILIALLSPLAADDARQPAAGAHRVLLLASTGPLLLDVRLETGSQSISEVRTSFCDSLFERVDADKSGKIEEPEQSQIPMFRRTGGGTAEPVQKFLTDGHLTRDGLRKYIDGQLGPEFAVEIRAPRLDQSVRLVDALDRDGDGVLSVDEVVGSSQLLSRYDLDDDESLSVGELQPFPQSVRQAMRQQATQEGRGGRIFLIESDGVLANAAAETLKSFSTGQGLELQRCGLNPEAAGNFDKDKNGRLDNEELQAWISKGTADLQVSAQWRKGRLPPVIEVNANKVGRVSIQKVISKSKWTAAVDGIPLEVNIRDNRSSAGDAVNFFVIEARRRDADKNGYLSEPEYAGLGTGSPFSAVDLNKDGMLFPEEMRQYFADMSRLSQARVVMTLSDEVTSLFQLMDADRTNRLSPREMATLRDRLTPYDRNKNGQFDAADFVSEFKLAMAFSTPEGLEVADQQAMPMAGATGGVRRTRLAGPLWFQRMDRNRDGDISWREFLGPRTKFDAVDTDHDGLISKDEAEAANAKAEVASSESNAVSRPAP
jgi:Ca2+-binding EF-hand superfamily protein